MTNLKGKVLVGLASVAVLGGVTVGSVGAFATETGRGETQVGAHFSGETRPPELDNTLQLITVPAAVGFGTTNPSNPGGLEAGGNVRRTGTLTGNRAVVRDGRESSSAPSTQWKLSAQATALTAQNADGSTETIANAAGVDNAASITLKSAGINSALKWIPGPSNVDPLTNDSTDGPADNVTKEESTTLDIGGAPVEFASATDSIGKGYQIPVDEMEMNLASGATQRNWAGKTFNGKIVWTLNDTV